MIIEFLSVFDIKILQNLHKSILGEAAGGAEAAGFGFSGLEAAAAAELQVLCQDEGPDGVAQALQEQQQAADAGVTLQLPSDEHSAVCFTVVGQQYFHLARTTASCSKAGTPKTRKGDQLRRYFVFLPLPVWTRSPAWSIRFRMRLEVV